MNHSHDPDGMSDENRENAHAHAHAHDHAHDHGDHNHDHGFDEPMLRRLLHDAVRDLEPQPQALNQLRQAIPARRTRRRQAMAGTAVGVLLVGVAVPALVHAAVSIGIGQDTANTASTSASRTPGTGRDSYGGNEFGGDSGMPTGALSSGGGGGSSAPSGSGKPSTRASSASPGASSQPPDTLAAAPPLCVRTQLGNGSAQTGTPDSQGRVYGSFTVLNVSHVSCTVTGGGQITVTGKGGTDASKIQVVDHTAGDPVTGLPDARMLPLVLAPGKGYTVAFAWIPAAGGSDGCSRDTSDTTSGGTGGTGGTDSSSGSGGTSSRATSPSENITSGSGTASTGSTLQNAPTGAGSPSSPPTPAATAGISLSHVPQQGGPAVASTSISGACTGTVYRSAPVATTS
jgi:hypothetical protein